MDQAFDDPVRKAPPREKVENQVEEVSTEKSEKGLGEIYEAEYMKQMHNVDKSKEEIKELFTRLCVSLDRLCNTHFTPSANTSTFSVVSSAPALSMEEALPISVSAEVQKAPEEVWFGVWSDT